MRARDLWRQHLTDLIGASLDPVIYAVQWARDPRCVQRGISHRRVGAHTESNTRICPLWLRAKHGWE
jgi:hypothetical protein